MKEKIKSVNARVPTDMHEFLRKYGFDRRTSVGGAIRKIVKKEMEKEHAETAK